MSQHLIRQVQELKYQVSLLQEVNEEQSDLELQLADIQASIDAIVGALAQAGVQVALPGGQETTVMDPEETQMPPVPAAGSAPVIDQTGQIAQPPVMPPIQYPQPNQPV